MQELEDLTKPTEEFDEETLRKMRKTLMSVDTKNKAIEEVKEEITVVVVRIPVVFDWLIS